MRLVSSLLCTCLLAMAACTSDYSSGKSQQSILSTSPTAYSAPLPGAEGGRYDPATDTYIPAATLHSGAMSPANLPQGDQRSSVGAGPVATAYVAPSYVGGETDASVVDATPDHLLGASREAEIFRQVCANNAPALEEYAIEYAARATIYSAKNIRGAGVAYDAGKSCRVNFGGAPAPADATIQSIAADLARNTGGSLRARKSAISGSKWYEVKIGRTKFGIEGGARGGVAYYTIAKR
ncbi:hypothetical protein [Phaeobacter inhibens]|uniref:hypothetical protein n=1 Tax=Phaeobacter inhibens TaxID=221822 RepID=UPI000AF3BD9A|nr:hypothetical protein [Phaeobacter inhibens]WHP68972.1 hypothetical protein QMZ01_01905 [Phaeobacter inhibens]